MTTTTAPNITLDISDEQGDRLVLLTGSNGFQVLGTEDARDGETVTVNLTPAARRALAAALLAGLDEPAPAPKARASAETLRLAAV